MAHVGIAILDRATRPLIRPRTGFGRSLAMLVSIGNAVAIALVGATHGCIAVPGTVRGVRVAIGDRITSSLVCAPAGRCVARGTMGLAIFDAGPVTRIGAIDGRGLRCSRRSDNCSKGEEQGVGLDHGITIVGWH